MSLSRRVERNAVGQLVGRLFTSTLAFVITALLLPRRLTPADFGIFAFHLSLYQLLTNVIDFGAGTIVVREASRDRGRAGALIGQLVVIKSVMAALGAGLLVAAALVFEGLGWRFAVLTVAALHLLFHAPGGAAAIFHVDLEFKWAVWAGVLGQAAWLAGTLALALAGVTRPEAYLLAFALGPVVNGVLCYAWARRRVAVTFDATRAQLAALWEQAWPAGVSMTLASVYFYIDQAMLRPMAGEVATGQYSAAYRLMTFALMVPVLFSQVVFPVFSRLWSAGAHALRPVFGRILALLFAGGLMVTVTAPQVVDEIMAVVYGDALLPAVMRPGVDLAVYRDASGCLAVLFLTPVLVFCAYPHVLALLASGHQRTMMLVSGSAALFNVVANLWAIPRLGILGAAWTTVATEGWVLVAAAWAVRRRTGLGTPLPLLVRPAAAALVAASALAAVLAWLPPGATIPRLAAAAVLAAAGLLGTGVLPVDLGDDVAPAGPDP